MASKDNSNMLRQHQNHPDSRRQSHHHKRKHPTTVPHPLPFSASRLSKHHFATYRPMFALYLDLHKQLVLDQLDETEGKGRWKSFVGKWNRGELAEGWYDPSVLQRAIESASAELAPADRRLSPDYGLHRSSVGEDGSESEGDAPGPALPDARARKVKKSRAGPAIPSMQDLELRQEMAEEDSTLMRADVRQQRRQKRALEKDGVEELNPRAEASTKERQLEKKRELASSNRAFASAKTEGGGMTEVPDAELLGGDEDGAEGYKRQKRELAKRKTEREIRREEIMRARMAEREERANAHREREEETMRGLVELARQRFG